MCGIVPLARTPWPPLPCWHSPCKPRPVDASVTRTESMPDPCLGAARARGGLRVVAFRTARRAACGRAVDPSRPAHAVRREGRAGQARWPRWHRLFHLRARRVLRRGRRSLCGGLAARQRRAGDPRVVPTPLTVLLPESAPAEIYALSLHVVLTKLSP